MAGSPDIRRLGASIRRGLRTSSAQPAIINTAFARQVVFCWSRGFKKGQRRPTLSRKKKRAAAPVFPRRQMSWLGSPVRFRWRACRGGCRAGDASRSTAYRPIRPWSATEVIIMHHEKSPAIKHMTNSGFPTPIPLITEKLSDIYTKPDCIVCLSQTQHACDRATIAAVFGGWHVA